MTVVANMEARLTLQHGDFNKGVDNAIKKTRMLETTLQKHFAGIGKKVFAGAFGGATLGDAVIKQFTAALERAKERGGDFATIAEKLDATFSRVADTLVGRILPALDSMSRTVETLVNSKFAQDAFAELNKEFGRIQSIAKWFEDHFGTPETPKPLPPRPPQTLEEFIAQKKPHFKAVNESDIVAKQTELGMAVARKLFGRPDEMAAIQKWKASGDRAAQRALFRAGPQEAGEFGIAIKNQLMHQWFQRNQGVQFADPLHKEAEGIADLPKAFLKGSREAHNLEVTAQNTPLNKVEKNTQGSKDALDRIDKQLQQGLKINDLLVANV